MRAPSAGAWTVMFACACGRTTLVVDDVPGDEAVLLVDASARPVGPNACGGRADLLARPGAPCGVCGVYVCASPDAVRCDDNDQRNACGGCGLAPMEVCNGRDDDCDGVVDNGCVRALGPPEDRAGQVRLSGDRAMIDRPVLVTLPSGSSRDLAPPMPLPDGGQSGYNDRSAAIDGDLAAWLRSGPPDYFSVLVTYDLRSGREYVVAEPGTYALSPAVDRDRVVFERHINSSTGGSDVWMWSLATQSATRLTGPEALETSPDLSGDWVVFERASSRDTRVPSHVVAHNLVTGEEVVMSSGFTDASHAPVIDGTRVVWHVANDGSAGAVGGQVFLYDLSTRARRALTRYGGRFRPRISGSLVCWSASSTEPPYSSSGEVTVFDLATGRSLVVASQGQLCDVSGRRVAFLEYFDLSGGSRPYYRELLMGEP